MLRKVHLATPTVLFLKKKLKCEWLIVPMIPLLFWIIERIMLESQFDNIYRLVIFQQYLEMLQCIDPKILKEEKASHNDSYVFESLLGHK